MVPAPPPGDLAPRRGRRFWALPVAVVAFVLLGAVLATSLLPARLVASKCKERDGAACVGGQVDTPYAIVPGSAEAVAPRMSFDAVPRYDSDGQLLFVTVREPELTMLEWFVTRDEESVNPQSDEEKNPKDLTPTELRQVNIQSMVTAKQRAEYVALTKLGYPTELVPGSVTVAQVLCLEADEAGTTCVRSVPADAVLDRGDTIVSVDGSPIPDGDVLREVLSAHQIGDHVTVVASREGQTVSGDVELISSQEDQPRAILGITPADTRTVKIPFAIEIATDEIGGPSAGLAFTLTILDELTPGSITGGAKVAVTGTIDLDGTVGAIGGLPSKAAAVKQTGASVFIVPASQSDDDLAAARAIGGNDMRIVTVATLDEALAALAELGGNALELGQPGAS